MTDARIRALFAFLHAPVAMIAALLQVSELRALEVQMRAAELLLPLVHERVQ